MANCCCCCGDGYKRRHELHRQTTVAQEESFKLEMEHLFENHGNEGIRLAELETELAETDLVTVIPRKKLQKMLSKADQDKNSYITYAEFMNMYFTSSQLTKSEKTAMRKFVGAAIYNIIPKYLREDFLKNYNCKPPPIFMVIISILEISSFIYFAVVLSREGGTVTAFTGIPTHNPLIYKPHRRYEAWIYLTYMFVHQGYVHLITNLVFQLLLGLPLEIVHKWWRLMIVYFCGVIGGSLAHSVTDYNVNLAGASGGCYAIIGAHLASVIVNWKEMNYKCTECENPVRILLSAPLRLGVLLLLVTLDTVNAVYRRFYDPDAGKVGISAHVGGLLTGLMLGITVMKNINILSWEKKVGWVTLSVYIATVIFCVLFNGLFKHYPETDWSACC